MNTSFLIKSFLVSLGTGKLFTTREVIGLGSRSSVDQCLYRLVHKKILCRVARGVFSYGEAPDVTAEDIARVKAESFGKQICEHPEKTAQALNFKPVDAEPVHVYAGDGSSSSSFDTIFGRIEIRTISARKRIQDPSEVWELLKALWKLGADGITDSLRMHIRRLWGPRSHTDLMRLRSSIPHWLLDEFPLTPMQAFKTLTEKRRESKSKTHDVHAPNAQSEPAFNSTDPAKGSCICPPSPDCICPEFTCQYCRSRRRPNKFRLP